MDKRLKQLRGAYKAQHISKKKFEQERAQLQTEMEGKIARKFVNNKKWRKPEYDKASAELAQTSNQALVQTQGQLQNAKGNDCKLSMREELNS